MSTLDKILFIADYIEPRRFKAENLPQMRALAFQDLTTALYGLIAQVVCAYVTDMVLYGLDTAKVAYIISEKAHEISDSIVGQMDRGVTVLPGKGAYSGENKLVLMCAFKQREIVVMKRLVKEIDPAAFLIVCDAHEVMGEGSGSTNKTTCNGERRIFVWQTL